MWQHLADVREAAAPAGPAPATDRAAVLLEAADELDRYVGEQSSDAAPEVYGARMVMRELRRLAGEAQQDERCTRCTHPKRDHDGRADHRAKYSPLVAGEPWCHACNAECDYAREARQDPTQRRPDILSPFNADAGPDEGRQPDAAVARPGQPETETEAVVVHARPEPGDNGISRCCGRPPHEFVGERLTRDPEKVTCRGD
jgi:hypothetical protein